MKTVDMIVEICDCGCQHCEYDWSKSHNVDCPYCDWAEEQLVEEDEGKKQKIQCSYCNKKYWWLIKYEYI